MGMAKNYWIELQERGYPFFAESATFHSCAPMSGTLTFQWHTFRGEGQSKNRETNSSVFGPDANACELFLTGM